LTKELQMRSHIGNWLLLITISIASLVTAKIAWATSFYWVILISLAIAALVIAFFVMRKARFKFWSVVGVIVCLVIGQWWLVQLILIIGFAKWRGFAP